MRNRIYILILIFNLTISCSNKNSEYDKSEVKLYAYQEAQIGGINFVLLKNGEFIVTRFGMFDSEKYKGIATISKDSIFLTYSDKNIDFQKIPLPEKIEVAKHRIFTELRGRKYHMEIGNMK